MTSGYRQDSQLQASPAPEPAAADPQSRLLRQLRYERALARCSRALLASADGLAQQQAVLTEALIPLLEAAQADRAYVFRNFQDPVAGLCMDMLAEACAPGIRPHIRVSRNHRYPWSGVPDLLRSTLQAKQPRGGPVERVFAGAQDLIDAFRAQRQPLRSVQLFPIHFGDAWWGYVGFDDCQAPREWDEQEVMLLRTASEVMGSALQRWEAEAQARQARDELEHRVEERTRELRQRLEAETALAAISSQLLTEADFEQAVQRALASVGQTLSASAVILMRAARDSGASRAAAPAFRPVHEWRDPHAGGLSPAQTALFEDPGQWLGSPLVWSGAAIDFADAVRLPPELPAGREDTPPDGGIPLIVVPLTVEQRVFGALACANLRVSREAVAPHLATVQVIAGMLTGLLQREEMLETLEQRVAERTQELSAFFDLAMLVSSTRDVRAILEPSLPKIMDIGQCQAVTVHLISSDEASLALAAQQGLPGAARDSLDIVLATPGLSSWLSRFERPMLSSDAGWPNQMPAAFHIEGYRSYLGAQLRAGGEVLGVLSCYREQGGFSLNHVSVLSALAEQLGVVIENHRLRQQAEETAIVSERQRLARELHDAVTQSLYSQALFARAAHNALEEGDRARLQDSLGQLGANAASALREMRLLLHQLRPAALEAGGLAQAIDDRLELVERRVGITAECRVDGRIQAGSDTEVMLYRVALEALNNALRHANATRVAVHVRARGGSVRLVVSDNGCGFDPARVSGGMGLAGMRDRVRQQGGKLRITSALGRGTVVRVSVGPAGETSGARRRSHE